MNYRKRGSRWFAESGDYLIHYGISGQKWGVRRFQNENGTLTEEGKERYRKMTEDRKKRWEEISNDKSRYWDENNSILDYSKFYDDKVHGEKIRNAFNKKEITEYNKKMMNLLEEYSDWIGLSEKVFSKIKKLPEEQQLFAMSCIWYDQFEDYLPFGLEEKIGTAH